MKRVGALITRALAGLALGVLAHSAYSEPSYKEYMLRAKFTEAMIYANQLELIVATYYIDHDNAWPSSLEEAISADRDDAPPGPSKIVRGASLDRKGVLTVTFQADVPELGGKSVIFSPSVGGDGALVWHCSAPEIAANYRSLHCR